MILTLNIMNFRDDGGYPPHYDIHYGPPVHGAPPPFWVGGGGEAPPHGPKVYVPSCILYILLLNCSKYFRLLAIFMLESLNHI